MEPAVRDAALAEIGRFRYVLRYTDRQRLKGGDLSGVARLIRRRAKVLLLALAMLTIGWLALFVFYLSSTGFHAASLLWWALFLGPALGEQARIETAMRAVLRFLDAATAPPPPAQAGHLRHFGHLRHLRAAIANTHTNTNVRNVSNVGNVMPEQRGGAGGRPGPPA